MRKQLCTIALAAGAGLMVFALTSPAHADFYSASCTGSSTQLICTGNASVDGNLFIDGSSFDINLSSTSVITSATETFTGGTATSSTVNTTASNVDGIGTFTITDDLSSSGSPGNPTADTITITINGTNLALASNNKSLVFGAHICLNGETNGGSCTTTFFTPVPAPIVGAGLPGLIAACMGLFGLARRRRRQLVAA